MDVYRQAAEIVKIVREGRGTAKALCLRKEMQKKRQTYAVVCETMRYFEVLEDVLRQAQFYDFYPRANRDLAMVLCYDTVVGKGVKTRADSTAIAIEKSAPYLREAFDRVRKHHVVAPRTRDDDVDFGEGGATDGTNKSTTVYRFPRYARVNTLKIEEEELRRRLTQPKRIPIENAPATTNPRKRLRGSEETADTEEVHYKEVPSRFPAFVVDEHIPNLWVFPHGTELHSHPSVRSGQLVLQDKSSCLPAAVMLDAVPVVRPFGDEAVAKATEAVDKKKKKKSQAGTTTSCAPMPLEYIVDGCAAPGNKTSQLAALGAPKGVKLLAVERDPKRSGLLQQRMQTLGAIDYVNVMNEDFFDLKSDVRDAAQGILLDPSCSASGVVSRVDVALAHGRADAASKKQVVADAEDDDDEASGHVEDTVRPSRQATLSKVQKKLLTHALLSFQNCHRVVYSTCSIDREENEDVVAAVLKDERVKSRGWGLSNIMPNTWKSRGGDTIPHADTDELLQGIPIANTIRCDPNVDRTNGFFVARFDRILVASPDDAGDEAAVVSDEAPQNEAVAAESAPVAAESAPSERRVAPKKTTFVDDSDSD